MEEALTTYLLANTALCGSRVHWMVNPQSVSTFPFMNLSVISSPREYNMAGPEDYTKSRVQIDVWAEKYSTAKTAAREIITALSGYKGTVSGVSFQGVFIDGERDLTGEKAGAEAQLYGVSVDIIINWN